MRTLKILITALFLITGIFIQTKAQSSASPEVTLSAQITDQQTDSYALLVRNYNHLQAAVKTVDMLNDYDRNIENFEVVLCGKKITQINSNKDLINEAQQKGITVTACGMSMNKFSMDKSALPDGVQVVPNGLIRIFDLQEKGYKTITL